MMDEHIEFQFFWNYDNQLDDVLALERLLREKYNIDFDTGGSPTFREWVVDESLRHPHHSRVKAIQIIRQLLEDVDQGKMRLGWSAKISYQEVSQ